MTVDFPLVFVALLLGGIALGVYRFFDLKLNSMVGLGYPDWMGVLIHVVGGAVLGAAVFGLVYMLIHFGSSNFELVKMGLAPRAPSEAAPSPLSHSWWASDKLAIVVRFDWPDFYIRHHVAADWIHCSAAGEQAAEQAAFGVAASSCSDGSSYAVEIGATHVRFDGHPLSPHDQDPAVVPGR